MRAFFFSSITLTLLVSCATKSKTENSNDSIDSTHHKLTNDEREYLTKRDVYIEQLQRIQKLKSPTDSFDSLYKAERKAIIELEGKSKAILKTSRFANKGEINLETLLGYLGFGMLDGLSFKKDSSTRIFYTTKNLFLSYVKVNEKGNPFDGLSPDVFANIFNNTFQSDVHVENYSFVKLQSPDNVLAYGMVAGLSQMIGPFPPQHIYVFVSFDKFVYMAEIGLKEPIKEIPKCKSVWDSIHTVAEKNLEAYRASDLNDTTSFNKGIEVDEVAYRKYCDCFNRELKNGGLIVPIQNQMELIATYLLRP